MKARVNLRLGEPKVTVKARIRGLVCAGGLIRPPPFPGLATSPAERATAWGRARVRRGPTGRPLRDGGPIGGLGVGLGGAARRMGQSAVGGLSVIVTVTYLRFRSSVSATTTDMLVLRLIAVCLSRSKTDSGNRELATAKLLPRLELTLFGAGRPGGSATPPCSRRSFRRRPGRQPARRFRRAGPRCEPAVPPMSTGFGPWVNSFTNRSIATAAGLDGAYSPIVRCFAHAICTWTESGIVALHTRSP